MTGPLVSVPLAPATGDPGANLVAVPAKPWFKSVTMWVSGSGLAYVVVDAVLSVAPQFLDPKSGPLDTKGLVRSVAYAIVLGLIMWRRKTDNSVVK